MKLGYTKKKKKKKKKKDDVIIEENKSEELNIFDDLDFNEEREGKDESTTIPDI